MLTLRLVLRLFTLAAISLPTSVRAGSSGLSVVWGDGDCVAIAAGDDAPFARVHCAPEARGMPEATVRLDNATRCQPVSAKLDWWRVEERCLPTGGRAALFRFGSDLDILALDTPAAATLEEIDHDLRAPALLVLPLGDGI